MQFYPRRKSVNKNKKNQKTVYPKNEAADISPERGFGDKANIYIGETGFVLRLEIKCAMSEKEIAERALISGVAVKESGTGKKYPQILLLCSSVASEDFLPAAKRLYGSIFGA